MSEAITCPYCGLYDKTQHSIKRGGVCSGIHRGQFRLHKGEVTIMGSVRKVGTLTPTDFKAAPLRTN